MTEWEFKLARGVEGDDRTKPTDLANQRCVALKRWWFRPWLGSDGRWHWVIATYPELPSTKKLTTAPHPIGGDSRQQEGEITRWCVV